MSRQIEFVGQSGARYRYMPLEEDRFLPPAGANFIITKTEPGVPTVLYAGETDSLAARVWTTKLEEARDRYGDVQVLTRLNVKSSGRREELADMLGAYNPEMNNPSAGAPSESAADEGDRPSL